MLIDLCNAMSLYGLVVNIFIVFSPSTAYLFTATHLPLNASYNKDITHGYPLQLACRVTINRICTMKLESSFTNCSDIYRVLPNLQSLKLCAMYALMLYCT